MLSAFFHGRETERRQQCREWFLASRHVLLAYARRQADSETDVELLVADVARNVTQAICLGKVSADDIMPYALRSLRNKAAALRLKNANQQKAEKRYGEEEQIRMQAPGEGCALCGARRRLCA